MGKFQVIEGGRIKPVAVTAKDVKEAYGRFSRADKPIGLATLAWELGKSQGWLASEFLDIVSEEAWRGGFKAGRASLWTSKGVAA